MPARAGTQATGVGMQNAAAPAPSGAAFAAASRLRKARIDAQGLSNSFFPDGVRVPSTTNYRALGRI
jgi:hypothetical protein